MFDENPLIWCSCFTPEFFGACGWTSGKALKTRPWDFSGSEDENVVFVFLRQINGFDH